jgi:Ca2+-transporting ATPase
LRGDPAFARHSVRELAGRSGVLSVTASPLTGRILILYDPELLTADRVLAEIVRLESATASASEAPAGPAGHAPPVTEGRGRRRPAFLGKALQPVVACTLLVVLAVKVALRGTHPRARSERLNALSVLTSALNGYRQLRRTARMVLGRHIPFGLASEYGGIALKGYRESLLGLTSDAGSYLFQVLELSALRDAQRSTREILHPRGHAHRRLPDGRTIDIPIADLRAGAIIHLSAGDHVPADAVVQDGAGLVDESILTSRAFLSAKGPGDPVFFGTRVQQGALLARVTATGAATRLGALLARVPVCRDRTLPGQVAGGIRRLGAAGLIAAACAFVLGRSWRRALAVLAVANPSAVTMSALAASGAAIEAAARAKVRIRRRNTLAALARVDVVLFGKTGTLTAEAPDVGAVVPVHETQDRVLALCAAAMRHSAHPLAVPVLEKALEHGLALPPQDGIEPLSGGGVRATIDGAQVVVGPIWVMRAHGVPTDVARHALARLEADGNEVLGVGSAGRLLGLVAFRERLLPGAREAVSRLRAAGIRELGVLSADPTASAQRLASELGITRTWSGVDDREKRRIVRRLRREGRVVAVVGASASDMLAMTEANVAVGFAGASWTPTPHTADVILLQGRLAALPALIDLGRRLRAVHRQNLAIAWTVAALGAAGAAIGLIPLAAADEINQALTLALIANARRLSFARLIRPPAPAEAVADGPAWHALPSRQALCLLRTHERHGLTSVEAARRRARVGPNALVEHAPPAFLVLLGRQLVTGMTLVLALAAGTAMLVAEPVNSALIAAVLVLNAALGAAQEHRAERTAAALRSSIAPGARALRDGAPCLIPAAELVPGDVIFLQAGDTVPADARLLAAHALETEEALLTGESLPVPKASRPVRADSDLADRTSMVYAGSAVAAGRATAVVVATGMRTAVGHTAGMLRGETSAAPSLQRRLAAVSRGLAGLSVLAGGLFVAAGLARRIPLPGLVMGGVSLVTAAIPEGLPTIVTIALSAAAQRMSSRKIIVRRLSAVETLGRVTVICCDKTGTLTQNRMVVRAVAAGRSQWTNGDAAADVTWLLTAGALCNDALLVNGKTRDTMGGSTEGALLMAAVDAGLDIAALRARYPRVMEVPFSTDRGFMAVVCRTPAGGWSAFIKGAPELVAEWCDARRVDGTVAPFDAAAREEAAARSEQMADDGMRVLAVAYRPLAGPPANDWLERPQGAIFAGLVGMSDPLRPEVAEAVRRCEDAGIRVVMLTGDHRSTAVAIARQLGLRFARADVLEGRAVEALSAGDLRAAVSRARVFARVTPVHKLRIVQAMQANGEVVAMTGDGVNDAPAVKCADVGIAMGHTGTEVTRQASSVILEDDSFVSIVRAIEEGRVVRRNLRRSAGFLAGGNLGETLFVLSTTLAGGEVALAPMHLLLVNLFTDALPVMALAARPAPPGALLPREPDDLFDRRFYREAARRGVVTGAAATVIYLTDRLRGPGAGRRGTTLAGLVASQLVQAYNWRQRGDAADRFFSVTLGVSWAALGAITGTPALRQLFGIGPVGLRDWARVLIVAFAADRLLSGRGTQQPRRLLPAPRLGPATGTRGRLDPGPAGGSRASD